MKLATRIKIIFFTALFFSLLGSVFAQTSKVELVYLMCKGKVTMSWDKGTIHTFDEEEAVTIATTIKNNKMVVSMKFKNNWLYERNDSYENSLTKHLAVFELSDVEIYYKSIRTEDFPLKKSKVDKNLLYEMIYKINRLTGKYSFSDYKRTEWGDGEWEEWQISRSGVCEKVSKKF